MVANAIDEKGVSFEQYVAIYRRSPAQIELPTVEALLESRIARLTSIEVATEADLRRLASHITERNFAFVPEWPDPLDFIRWMKFVEHGGRKGVNYLVPTAAKDFVTVPKGLFVMLDVDDGSDRRNTSSYISRTSIERAGRIPFTIRMGVSFAGDYPCAIDDYGMDLVGSGYGSLSKGAVPDVSIRVDEPALHADWNVDSGSPYRGAPSCGRVVGLDD
jgi:hypothetical protein